ncbi:MAG: DUF1902 domain-containing protein [Myxacorys californica WJT36-NPBG1]|jgi:predicted RNase H-like HicB family nuclease|nr:DUF1902 domain-containing protein [Myxacorys californica WJT36-NPBG1]
MVQLTCSVKAFWDSEVKVWVATSEDVPGLATEAPTIEALTEKLRVIIPELILLNRLLPEQLPSSVNFQLISLWEEQIEVAS